jgi:hypothetical protein
MSKPAFSYPDMPGDHWWERPATPLPPAHRPVLVRLGNHHEVRCLVCGDGYLFTIRCKGES